MGEGGHINKQTCIHTYIHTCMHTYTYTNKDDLRRGKKAWCNAQYLYRIREQLLCWKEQALIHTYTVGLLWKDHWCSFIELSQFHPWTPVLLRVCQLFLSSLERVQKLEDRPVHPPDISDGSLSGTRRGSEIREGVPPSFSPYTNEPLLAWSLYVH